MQRYFIVLILVFSSITAAFAQFSAQEIIDKTIEKAGGSRYDNAIVHFVFRGKQYRSKRGEGVYELERFVEGIKGLTHDVISNSGLKRTIENCPVKVADSLVTRISDGVNSVHYFASLPYGLNAPAVHKKLIGESSINGVSYYKIKVTFNQEGGGTDFEDEFMYWIHKKNFTVDYLAYKYAVNEGGIRFREAYNPRIVNGIRFVDYKNYKTDDLTTPLYNLDKLFENKKLKLLSKIELEDIYVYIERDCC
ncbi:hypothetical protein ATE84_4197 [Aquimarina sp. MAR_2010_214]|uniref:DUF6503 family protein n=1 Tax=Aquimarina sp. MAR_2010_214 TaxID=1250026 RepID=UPI000C713E24|nr:DUF6503 family protein [Aquimarina sp. MAR_2010_214]PKV52095.1 hypothetical protein ATE84_4197 [Aquimarina sp. MAR_2010_214]